MGNCETPSKTPISCRPKACPKALDLLLLSSLDQIKGPRAARLMAETELIHPNFMGDWLTKLRENPLKAKNR